MVTMSQALEAIAHDIESAGTDIAARYEYDLESILYETYEFYRDRLGWVQIVSPEMFWQIVATNRR